MKTFLVRTLFILLCGIPFTLAAFGAFLASIWLNFCCRRSVNFMFAREWWLKVILP